MTRHMIDECHAHGVILTPCAHRPNEGLENDGDVPFRHPLDLLSARGLDHIYRYHCSFNSAQKNM